jgi:hypothetical protein
MTSTQLRENIDDGLIRLKRHYDICVQGYDRPALKDLVSSLRIWMDMRKWVDTYLTINKSTTKFSFFAFPSAVNRIVRNIEYVIAVFPGSVHILNKPGMQIDIFADAQKLSPDKPLLVTETIN